MSGEMVTQGLVCAHVDDFIVVGSEGCEEWVDALTQFYHRFDWSDWESGSFSHCGVILKENEEGERGLLGHPGPCELCGQSGAGGVPEPR